VAAALEPDLPIQPHVWHGATIRRLELGLSDETYNSEIPDDRTTFHLGPRGFAAFQLVILDNSNCLQVLAIIKLKQEDADRYASISLIFPKKSIRRGSTHLMAWICWLRPCSFRVTEIWKTADADNENVDTGDADTEDEY
jgi:hypothetical protein